MRLNVRLALCVDTVVQCNAVALSTVSTLYIAKSGDQSSLCAAIDAWGEGAGGRALGGGRDGFFGVVTHGLCAQPLMAFPPINLCRSKCCRSDCKL